MNKPWTKRIEELEAEVDELTGDLPPMQLTDNERRDGHSALRWNKGKQAIETFDPHPSVGLTDDERKVLTEYLGECWHSKETWYDCDTATHCKRRTFTTPADLHAVYSKMVERKEWEEFQNHMVYKYREVEKDDYTRWFVAAFEKWLFCLACPEQIPERMEMAAGWIRAKGCDLKKIARR
jgi:hypothetical protein